MQAKPKIALLSLLLSASIGANEVLAGECGTATSSAVTAIPFDYYVTKDKGRWITFSATSNQIQWSNLNQGWPRRYKAFKFGGGAAISEWKIDALPANGVLYDGTKVLAAGDVVSDPDNLYYTPKIGFVGHDPFTYCASDSSGKSAVATVNMIVADAANYPMPYGVPNPGFGINEEPPADPPQWPSSEATGYYYIDSDHPSCSDSLTYGYPNAPRCSIAYNSTVGAGRKMVLAPSTKPYPTRSSTFDQLTLNGTSASPAWVVGDERGPNKPRITQPSSMAGERVEYRIAGTGNWRIGGVDIDGPNLSNRGSGANIVIRYSRARNYPSTAGGGTTVGLNSSNGTDQNQMAFHVNAHDNGIVEPNLADERDIHAFTVVNQKSAWYLDILCSENAGDCVQLTNNNTSANIYVGRATMHSMMENCTDYKDFNNFVVSESDCWDIRRVSYASGSGGNAQNFYVNDEGNQQGYGFFLNNRSWDTNGENFGSSNIGGNVYFIGNVAFFSPQAVGLSSTNGNAPRHYYFNTVHGVKDGMSLYTTGSSTGRYIVGNLISNASRYAVLTTSAYSQISEFDHNAYVNSGNYAWGSNSSPNIGTFAQFKAATGFDSSSVVDTKSVFVSTGAHDLRLLSSAFIKDVVPKASLTSLAPGLTDLRNRLGVQFVDFNGTSRTENYLDIGADEQSGETIAAPMFPSDIKIELTE